ncbi:iron-sulfur cluster assembly protein, partial [Streptomyces sp. NPDC048664]
MPRNRERGGHRSTEALATVNDPEIQRPITELGMVKSVEIG